MEIETMSQGREDGLNQIGQAYLDVKNGKAGVVMICVRDGDVTVQTAGISTVDGASLVAQANSIMVAEMRKAMAELLSIADDMDRQLNGNDADGNA